MIEQTKTRLVKAIQKFLPDQYKLLEGAIALAEAEHSGQLRKQREDQSARDPYIIHPMRAALILLEEFHIDDVVPVASAILHDVLEDGVSELSQEDLQSRFGTEIAATVDLVTKKPSDGEKMTEDELRAYHDRISQSGQAVKLTKLADRLDNMRECCLIDRPEFQKRYLEETLKVFIPLAESTHAGFAQALREVCDELSNKLASGTLPLA